MCALGALIAIGYFISLVYLIYIGNFKEQVGIVLYTLVGVFSMVVAYFYGSSKGSADKNELLKK